MVKMFRKLLLNNIPVAVDASAAVEAAAAAHSVTALAAGITADATPEPALVGVSTGSSSSSRALASSGSSFDNMSGASALGEDRQSEQAARCANLMWPVHLHVCRENRQGAQGNAAVCGREDGVGSAAAGKAATAGPSIRSAAAASETGPELLLVWVGSLPLGSTSDQLQAAFEVFGPIMSISLTTSHTQKSLTAYVEFASAASAASAVGKVVVCGQEGRVRPVSTRKHQKLVRQGVFASGNGLAADGGVVVVAMPLLPCLTALQL